MTIPNFLRILIASLAIDLVLLLVLPLLGPIIYLALAVMIFLVPIGTGLAYSQSLSWMSQYTRAKSAWSDLSRLMCGSGLTFLFIATAYATLPVSRDDGLYVLLGKIYLLILVLRFFGAGLGNVLFSIITLFKGRSQLDRLSSISAILSSAAAIAILQPLFANTLSIDPDQIVHYALCLLFFLGSFAYGLMWGGALHWLARGANQES